MGYRFFKVQLIFILISSLSVFQGTIICFYCLVVKSFVMVHGKKVVAAPVEAPPQNNPQAVTPKSSLPPSFSKGDEVAKEPLKQTIAYLERRLLNLEKRKERLDGYQKQIDEGVQLRSNKEMAVAKREEVAGSINFAQEILNVLSLLSTEVDQVNEKAKENEAENKVKMDLARSQFIAKSLAIFNLFLSNEQIQRDFLEGRNNAVMLEQSELDVLLNFSRNCLFSTHNTADNVLTRSEKCGQHLNNLFDRSSSTICRSTYANIAVIASKIFECEYFQSLPDFSQTVEAEEDSNNKNEFEPNCIEDEEEEEEEDSTDVAKTGIEFSSNLADRISPSLPDTQPDIDTTDKNLAEKHQSFTKEPTPPLKQQSAYDQLQNIIGNSADPQLQQVSFMSFQVEEPQKEPEPTPSEEMKRPAHTIEEVLADVQGQYNFLQDSMLDVDSVENNITNFSGVGMQPSSLNPDPQDSNVSPASQFNSGPQSVEKDTFLSNGPSITSNDVASLHNPNSLYPNAQMYAPEAKLIPNQDTQLASQADNLGMGQTTFGSNEPAYNIDIPVRTQYNDSLHSVDAYQNKPTDINIMKPLQENTYTTSPFNSLHGTSQSPFEGSLAGSKIPDPIPMPSGSSLTSVDPSQVHIPFPTDKMSGYRGFAGNSQTLDGTAVPGNVENESERFALDEKPHQQSLLSAGDAVHISSSGLKLDSNSIESVTNDVKAEDKNDIATTSRINSDKSSAHQMNRGNRHPAAYQNTSSNYNRGNAAARQQGPPVSGFYQNRSGNFRSTHNRNFGNFDSMGHPKHYGNAGGGYQHPQGGIHPYNANYNRQDNNIYGGMQRRGAGGSGRGNRGFPSRVNMRGANNNNNYNRTRTFRPHNSEPVA